MAETAAAILAELDSTESGNVYQISKHVPAIGAGTEDLFYVTAVRGPNQGKSCWCTTTTADSAADQAASVLAKMTAAGPT
jgi:hypothetical protein